MATNNSKIPTARVSDFASELPPTLYWDASFIVHATFETSRWHAECRNFLARLDSSDTVSFVSTLALDESWFVLLQLVIVEDHPDRAFWRVVNEQPDIIAQYIDRLESATDAIYNNPRIRVVAVGAHTPRLALNAMREFYLLPRDAMHLATMRQYKLTHLVTTDADFLPVLDLTLYTCNPALLAR